MYKTSNILKNSLFLALTFFIFSIAFLFTPKAFAANEHILSGWAWSDNIGWISFNCDNTSSCGTVDYSVIVDQATGHLSGYAWSSNIGWISFNSGDVSGCPSVITCQPTMVFNSSGANGAYFPHIIGFARALSPVGSSSGWDGYISLSCNNDSSGCGSSNYGVTIPYSGSSGPTSGTNNLSGFAWGSTVVGWVDFSSVTITTGGSVITLVATDSNDDPITSVPDTSTPINLTWTSLTSTNYDSCVGVGGDIDWDGVSLTLPSSGNSYTATLQNVSVPTDPTTFTIECTIGGQTDTASVTIDVSYVWDLKLIATPETILSGSSSLLEWWTTSPTTNGVPPLACGPDWAWTSSTSDSGSQSTGNLTGSTTYGYTCTSISDPSDSKTAVVTVKVLKIEFFKLDHDASCYSANDTGPTLWWAAPNADSCTITAPGGAKASVGRSGKYKFSGGGEGIYTLECSSGSGTDKISVSDTLDAEQCIPSYALNSAKSCSGKTGQLTDNSFQPFGGSGQYKAVINVKSSADNGFSSLLKYSFAMPADWDLNGWSITGWTPSGPMYESGNVTPTAYSSTFEIIAPNLASVNNVLNGKANNLEEFIVNSDTFPPTGNTSSGTYSVCAPGGGSIKPIFIEQ